MRPPTNIEPPTESGLLSHQCHAQSGEVQHVELDESERGGPAHRSTDVLQVHSPEQGPAQQAAQPHVNAQVPTPSLLLFDAWSGGGEAGIRPRQACLACSPPVETLGSEDQGYSSREGVVDCLTGVFQPWLVRVDFVQVPSGYLVPAGYQLPTTAHSASLGVAVFFSHL